METYLKQMDVPAKYADRMFSIPKEQLLWISEDDYEADLKIVPSLRDWVEAKCKLTDIEKIAEESIKKKPYNKQTKVEQAVAETLSKKQWDCEQRAKFELRKDAWQRWRKEALQNIADMCAARKRSLPAELSAALSMALPNQQSAAAALNLAQTAALCKDYGLRENAIRLLADRGDAKAQRILGNLYFFGGSTIATERVFGINTTTRDRTEGMAWYGRAGAQGDLYVQRFHHDLSAAFATKDHHFTTQENYETGLWHSRNCPALC